MVEARTGSLSLGVLAMILLALASGHLAAQDVVPQWSGRLNSAWTATEAAGGQTVGLVTGWTGLAAGTRDVKSELRWQVTTLPVPTASLSRAWLKFRFPGVRVTTGLGRLGWGPGLVLVPGDLLFDSVGTNVDFQSDELRPTGAWLGDIWVSLGEEAFAEAAARDDAVGARLSAAPLGISLEAAGAWNRTTGTAKAAVSAQFHAGVDWYATVRQDAAVAGGLPGAMGMTSGGAGAFGLWDLGEGWTLTSRHELWAADPGPATRLEAYDDAALASSAGWSVTARTVASGSPLIFQPSLELRWGPLQNLGLFLSGALSEPRSVALGATAKW